MKISAAFAVGGDVEKLTLIHLTIPPWLHRYVCYLMKTFVCPFSKCPATRFSLFRQSAWRSAPLLCGLVYRRMKAGSDSPLERRPACSSRIMLVLGWLSKQWLRFAPADDCGFLFLPLQLFGCIPKQTELRSAGSVHASLRPCAGEEGRDGPPTSPQRTRASPAGVSPSVVGGVEGKQGDGAAPTAEGGAAEWRGSSPLEERGAGKPLDMYFGNRQIFTVHCCIGSSTGKYLSLGQTDLKWSVLFWFYKWEDWERN